MSLNLDTLPYRTEETYIPIIDSLGPFYDETILSSIDKCLYLLGVQKMAAVAKSTLRRRRCGQEEGYETCDTFGSDIDSTSISISPQFGISSNAYSTSTCGALKRGKQRNSHAAGLSSPSTAARSPVRFERDSFSIKPAKEQPKPTANSSVQAPSLEDSVRFLEHPMVQDLICPICGKNSGGKPDISHLQTIIEDYQAYQDSPLKFIFRKAVSKVKKVFSGSSQTAKNNADLDWFWTRKRDEESHKILEIYENSDVSKHPSQSTKDNLSMILVVTPSGVVMPFEPVKN